MASKSGKKKLTQQDLRRLMNEQKNKLVLAPKKIDSPLAKYTSSGQLMCIMCNCVVKSESMWSAHIISKEHKNYRSRSKQLRDSTTALNQLQPAKKLKGILKNVHPPGETTTSDSSTVPDMVVNTDVKIVKSSLSSAIPLPKKADLSYPNVKLATTVGVVKETPKVAGSIPRGFFDDPELDAKARNVEYKNSGELEWAKFQREIKEETDLSAQIISEDQDLATAERQIDEIDEQMMKWERVIELEQRLEVVKQQEKKEKVRPPSPDDMEFDEFPDWRRKKAFTH